MMSYDPCLDFFIFYIVAFITTQTCKGKKPPNQNKHPNPFQVAIWASDNSHLFPPYWENLQLYLNKQELWTVSAFFPQSNYTHQIYMLY